MGEVAEMMLEGLCCQCCGEFFHDDEECGFPRTCAGCGGDDYKPANSGKKRRAKRRRQRQAQKKREILASANAHGWKQHTEYHWSKSLCGLRFDYWPSGRKAMFNGTVYKNIEDIAELERALEKGFKS